MPIELAQQRRHRPDKHAGIPAEVAFAQERLGKIDIGLFAKSNDPMDGAFTHTVTQMHRFAVLDITEAGTGPRWFYTDSDESAGFLGRRRRQCHRFTKRFAIGDDVIGREHNHGRSMIADRHPAGAQRYSCGRIALRRFRHDVFGGKTLEQIAHSRFLLDVRQHQDPLGRDPAVQSRDRVLE